MKEDIVNAVRILEQGGIILYPTDTIWGIGCDATNEKAVQKIYQIKKREDLKSMLVLIDTPDKLYQYVTQIPDVAWEILDAAVSPVTIIYPGVKNLAANLIAGDRSSGFRITGDRFCQQLIHRFKKPVVSTSANISGKAAPQVFIEIDPVIKKSVDYIVNWRQDDLSRHKPSGIIKLGVNGEIKIIRE